MIPLMAPCDTKSFRGVAKADLDSVLFTEPLIDSCQRHAVVKVSEGMQNPLLNRFPVCRLDIKST